MRNFLAIAILAILAFPGVNSCKNKKEVQAENKIPGGTWMVETMHGDTISDIDYMRGSPSIIFNDSSTFSGSTGCNQYSARFKVLDGGVEITMGPMTKMACPGKDESIFVEALNSTNKVKIEEERMHFFKNDEELLGFKKVE
ncbi:META domain-containing protein [Cryomorpha ignava]|uniref:META domain-containing protein n=1 Tax=Cryomorpha ignava TaxID=101383 RepID=A0A7K3WSF4_9FLAO|nr:META domain-containing protein [Cryomorpha ignava]NEN24414.1 META domain-containing protein [Cryomorpha ignava]